MSIVINKEKCAGCGQCSIVCPGSLIKMGEDKKAYMKYPKDCWGCSSCIKECKFEAIALYLGADMGGMGSNSIEALRGNRLMLRGIGLNEKELEILGISHAGE